MLEHIVWYWEPVETRQHTINMCQQRKKNITNYANFKQKLCSILTLRTHTRHIKKRKENKKYMCTKRKYIYKWTIRHTARTRFRMGLQIPLYQQPERHYERRATPPQPDRTSKVCLPSTHEIKANCPFLIQAFVNSKLNVSTLNISIYARPLYIHIYVYITILSFVSLLFIIDDSIIYSNYHSAIFVRHILVFVAFIRERA